MPDLPNFISSSILRGRYVFLNLESGKGVRCPVACAGWEDCAHDYEIRRSGFQFPAIEYIAGGEWEFVTDAGKWLLGPGSVFTYGPGVAYSIKARSHAGLCKYFLDFSDRTAVNRLRQAGLDPGRPGVLVQRRWIHDLLDQLIDVAQMRATSRMKVAGLISSLLLERIKEDIQPPQQLTQARLTFERCREYLASHYLRVSSLAEAARSCGVSPVHLCRLFQRFGNESPRSFVVRLKMSHAAERITRGNLPVKAAAAEVGFDDPFHFSRVFKGVHGMPPSKFGSLHAR